MTETLERILTEVGTAATELISRLVGAVAVMLVAAGHLGLETSVLVVLAAVLLATAGLVTPSS